MSLPFHNPATEIHHDDVVDAHLVVGHAARFDGDKTSVTVDAAGVSPRQGDEAVLHQAEVGAEHLLSETGPDAHGSGRPQISRNSKSSTTIASLLVATCPNWLLPLHSNASLGEPPGVAHTSRCHPQTEYLS